MKAMKKLFAGIALAGLATLNAQAQVVVPQEGFTSLFTWDSGVGPAITTFSLDVTGPSAISVTLRDDFIPGDEFALLLDGKTIDWTTAGNVGSYFQGVASGVFLGTGSHLFEIAITKGAEGYTTGGAWATFSAVSAVPEPATYGMLGAGLAVVGFMARRRKQA